MSDHVNDTDDSNDICKSTADILFAYLHDIIYNPQKASLDINGLPESFVSLGKGLQYLEKIVNETRTLANELAAGNLHCKLPPPGNEIAAPLKNLHASLMHLTWQAQLVAKGNYNQRVIFMGEFSDAFNDMIMQLKQKESHNLEEKSKLKTSIAKMSHEIRTPLNAILGMAELTLREEMSNTAREYNLTIKQAGGSLLSIINDILDFSKIESGLLEIVPDEYLFSSLINDVINISKIRVLDSRLRFVVNIDSSLPNKLFGDEVRIRQIMLNLLSNAIKYTDVGFVSFVITGKIVDDTVNLTIEVSDSGRGIKEENLSKLFSEFAQFDLHRNKGIEGTGLGLAITRSLVMMQGGEIHVTSEYGKGSVFTVTLPQKIRSRENLVHIKNPEDKNVLIFERREIYINSITRTMQNLGVNYKLVSTAQEFFNELVSQKFSFAFVAAALYRNVRKLYTKIESNAKIVLIAEFGETVPEKNISVLTTPLFSIPVANFLNGVSDSYTRNVSSKFSVKFIAPEASVLVVDDIKTNLTVSEGLMRPYNMHIDLSSGGQESIDAVKLYRYDLVLMDHMMPGMDGIEALTRIRALEGNDEYYKNLPIVALTANAVSGTKEMLQGHGFNDFLSKPIDIAKLDSILEKWIPKEKQKKVKNQDSVILTGVKSTVAESAVTGDAVKHDIEITDVDISKGITMAGSFENYLQILTVYRGDCEEKIRQIRTCIEEGDLPLYTIYVHALKSASANIGAIALSKSAANLETAGKQGDLIFIEKNNENFISEMEEMIKNIEQAMSAQSVKNQNNQMDMDLFYEVLGKLSDAMTDYDIPAINEAAKNLQSYTQTAFIEDQELNRDVEKILEYKLIGNYDEALSLIKKYHKG